VIRQVHHLTPHTYTLPTDRPKAIDRLFLRERASKREKETQRETHTERKRQRDRDRETERDTDRQTDRQRQRQTETGKVDLSALFKLGLSKEVCLYAVADWLRVSRPSVGGLAGGRPCVLIYPGTA